MVGLAANKVDQVPPPPKSVTAGNGAAPKPGVAGKAPKSAGIGDKVKDGKFTFTVTKVAPGPKRIGDQYFGKSPQGKFIFVHVTVRNHGDEAQSFFGTNQKLLAGGKEYSADNEASVYLPSSKSLYEEINPGNQVKGVVIFDVPESMTPEAIELHDSVLSGGVIVALG